MQEHGAAEGMQAEDFGDLMWSQMLDEVTHVQLNLIASTISFTCVYVFNNNCNTNMYASIASTACDTNHGPLPDCSFIASNQPVPRPAPLTTATKKGKATAKRTPAARNSKEQTVKKTKASGNKQ